MTIFFWQKWREERHPSVQLGFALSVPSLAIMAVVTPHPSLGLFHIPFSSMLQDENESVALCRSIGMASDRPRKSFKGALALVDLAGLSLAPKPTSQGQIWKVKAGAIPSIPINIEALGPTEFYLLHGLICHFNRHWRRLTYFHQWISISWKPLPKRKHTFIHVSKASSS